MRCMVIDFKKRVSSDNGICHCDWTYYDTLQEACDYADTLQDAEVWCEFEHIATPDNPHLAICIEKEYPEDPPVDYSEWKELVSRVRGEIETFEKILTSGKHFFINV